MRACLFSSFFWRVFLLHMEWLGLTVFGRLFFHRFKDAFPSFSALRCTSRGISVWSRGTRAFPPAELKSFSFSLFSAVWLKRASVCLFLYPPFWEFDELPRSVGRVCHQIGQIPGYYFLKKKKIDRYVLTPQYGLLGFPADSDGKEFACNAGDLGSIPGSGRSAGEGNGNPLQHPCLENPMDGGAW